MLSLGVGLTSVPVLARRGGYDPLIALAQQSPDAMVYPFYDPTSLWADAAGTVPAVEGGIVRRIDDRSGKGRHRVAPSDAESALLMRDELGVYCLEFSKGTEHYPLAATVLNDPAGASALFAVVAMPEATYRNIYSEGRASSAIPFKQFSSGNLTTIDHLIYGYTRNDANTLVTVPGAKLVGDASRHVLAWIDNAKTITPRENGVDGTPVSYAGTQTLDQSAIGCLYRDTKTGFFLGRMYALAGYRKVPSAGQVISIEQYLAGKIRRDAHPAWPVLNRWLAGGTSGKKAILSGDSTTSAATELFAALERANEAGEPLAGVTFLNRGESGRRVEDFIAGTGAYPLASIIAEAADLYVLCWGINNVRNGQTSQATLASNLATAVNAIQAALPNADIILWSPNSLVSSNESGNTWVNPTASGQTYSDILFTTYEALVGQWPHVAVLHKQQVIRRTSPATIAGSPYMLDELHPNSFGRGMIAGELIDAIRGPA